MHQCGVIHYTNPKIVAGTLPIWENEVLLCQRAIEPRKGFWTLPAGFLENGETILEGAVRETRKKKAEVIDSHLYTIFSLPHISQIYVFFRSNLAERKFRVELNLSMSVFLASQKSPGRICFPCSEPNTSTFLSRPGYRGLSCSQRGYRIQTTPSQLDKSTGISKNCIHGLYPFQPGSLTINWLERKVLSG